MYVIGNGQRKIKLIQYSSTYLKYLIDLLDKEIFLAHKRCVGYNPTQRFDHYLLRNIFSLIIAIHFAVLFLSQGHG